MSKQVSITENQPKKQEKLTTLPAALSYPSPAPKITTEQKPTPPKIEAKPIPTTPPKPQPKINTTQEQKPIPKELKILLDSIEEIEGILYAARQKISQLYGPVDYSRIEDIELCFPEEIAHKLSFEQKNNWWIIKPKTFLGSELFSKTVEIIKELDGEYISAGKDSHFRVKRN